MRHVREYGNDNDAYRVHSFYVRHRDRSQHKIVLSFARRELSIWRREDTLSEWVFVVGRKNLEIDRPATDYALSNMNVGPRR